MKKNLKLEPAVVGENGQLWMSDYWSENEGEMSGDGVTFQYNLELDYWTWT